MSMCESLHEWANSLPTFRFPFDDSVIPLNGIYILFEKGEVAHGAKRTSSKAPPFCAPLTLWLSMIAVVGLASRVPPHRARDGCAPACHPRSTGRNRPILCSSAEGLWAAPAIGSRSTARRKFRSKSRARQSCACGHRAWPEGPWARQPPIRRQSDHSDNEDRCGP